LEGCASWDRGKGTWGGWERGFGGLVEEDDRKWDHSRVDRISSGMKKSNIDDNIGDGGKVVGETIGTYGGIRGKDCA
nr:hypothetical protein [Tanacetum cinerariifolium]